MKFRFFYIVNEKYKYFKDIESNSIKSARQEFLLFINEKYNIFQKIELKEVKCFNFKNNRTEIKTVVKF